MSKLSLLNTIISRLFVHSGIAVLLGGIICGTGWGKVYYLTLDSALELAGKANPDIVKTKINLQTAEALYKANRADLYPSLRLDLISPNYSESLSEQYVYNSVSNSYGWKWMPTGDYRYQGTVYVEQKLPSGGEFNLSSMFYKRDYFIGSSTDSLETEYSNIMQFSIEQPLFQPNSVRSLRRKSSLDYQSAKLNSEIKRRDLDYIIAVAYYNLVRAEKRLKLEREDYARWGSSVETALAKYSAGLIPEVEVLKLQVELARREGNLSTSLANYLDRADELKVALGLELTDSLALSPDIGKIAYEAGSPSKAAAKRQELLQSEIGIEKSDINYREVKGSHGVNAYLQAYYLFDAKEPELDMLSDSYERDRGLSLTFSIPMLDWKQAKHTIESAELDLRLKKYDFEQLKKDFLIDLKQAARSVESTKAKLGSSELAGDLAERSYAITLSRFESGAVTSTDLIDAQVSLNLARHELLDSVIDYNIAVIKYKTLFFPEITSGESK